MILGWILGSIFLGSVGALAMAGVFLFFPDYVRRKLLPALISYATGSLLGGALLGLIPHALENAPAHAVMLWLFAGIVLFFILEKLVIWRHCHVEECTIHTAAGPLIIVGDAVHNLVDGVTIAAAYLTSTELGIAATIAVISHEIPQEVGDFAILLNSGYSTRRAIVMNTASSLTAFIGAVAAYLLLRQITHILPYIMAISAASFIYIAAADLIPGLHRDFAPRHIILQVSLIAAGAVTILLLHH